MFLLTYLLIFKGCDVGYSWVFGTVDGLHGVDEEFKEDNHLAFIFDDDVNISVWELNWKTLPTEEWNVVQLFQVHGVKMLP